MLLKKRQGIVLLVLIVLLPGKKLLAQLGAASLKGPGIAFSVDYLPASHYIRPEDSVKTRATTAQRRYNFGISCMLSNKTDTVTHKTRSWALAASGSYSKLSNEKYDKNIFPSELLTTELALQHYRSLGGKWGLMAILSGAVSYDREQFSTNDIFINGGVLFVKQANPHFSYGFGAVLTNTFGVPMLLPAFIMKWQTEHKFKIELNLPEKAGISYNLNKQDNIALNLRLRGEAYNLQNRPDTGRLMAYKEISAGLENTLHLSKKVDFVAAAGSVFYSGVEFRKKSLSQMFTTAPFHRLSANYFLSAGLRWSF